jgi:hypothetical protein
MPNVTKPVTHFLALYKMFEEILHLFRSVSISFTRMYVIVYNFYATTIIREDRNNSNSLFPGPDDIKRSSLKFTY